MVDSLIYLVLLSPLVFGAAGLSSLVQPGTRPWMVKRVSSLASIVSIAVGVFAALHLYFRGNVQSPLLGWQGLGFSIRLDALSVTMLCMIVLLAYVIVRFSHNYLEGDSRHGLFLGRLAATTAAVEMLVLSGNLAVFFVSWLGTSLLLHTLLVFYPDRPGAVVSGFKKFIAARTGDVCLLAASGLLYFEFGTGQLGSIFHQASEAVHAGSLPGNVEAAAILLAITALLKSAQFPTHGWLVEVMETPTPVSALLHAGILNAGPFLAARMAYVMSESTGASLLLILFGGFTALFASSVLLTQPAVKVALGYSSAAHMGFMLFVCGLGVYPAAILHLVAHSFYKAHAFLSSGSVVDQGKAEKVPIPQRLGHPVRVALSILLAVALYVGFVNLWGMNPLDNPSRLAIGIILVMGLAQIITPAVDSAGGVSGMVRSVLLATAVATHFFVLETAAHNLLDPVMPHASFLGYSAIVLAGMTVLVFGTAVFLQILGPTLSPSSLQRRWGIHLRKGLYANALFDRLVGAFDQQFRKETQSTRHRA